jgi:hypothetical protein
MTSSPPTAPRSRRLLPLALVGVLAVGLLGGYLLSGSAGGDGIGAGGEASDASAPEVLATPEGEPVPDEVDAQARALLEEFIAAEEAQEWDASFALLTPADQDELGPVNVWIANHANTPPFTGIDILSVRTLEGRTEVVADVTLASTLDEFRGFVPARGRATFGVEDVEGAWRVAFTRSVLQPRYPDDGPVAEEALQWAQARQSCEPNVREHPRLLGAPSIALALCGSQGEIRVGEIRNLTEGEDATPFVSAYGAQVFDWTRVVAVTGEVPMRVVLAPIDDRWTVIGVLRADG